MDSKPRAHLNCVTRHALSSTMCSRYEYFIADCKYSLECSAGFSCIVLYYYYNGLSVLFCVVLDRVASLCSSY